MNPYAIQSICKQYVIPPDKLHWKSANTTYYGNPLPTTGSIYWVTAVREFLVRDLVLPLHELLNDWTSADTLCSQDMYLNILSETTGEEPPPSKLFLKYDPLNGEILVAVSWKYCTNVSNHVLRLRSEKLYSDNFSFELVAGSIVAGQTFNVDRDDLLVINGSAIINSVGTMDGSLYEDSPVTLFRKIIRIKQRYTDILPYVYTDQDEVRWRVFDPDRVDAYKYLPISSCSFFVGATSISAMAAGIPLTKVKQLTQGAFLIDEAFLEALPVVDGTHDIVCVFNSETIYEEFDRSVDNDWLYTLYRLSPEERLAQYMGIAVHQVENWTVANLLNNYLLDFWGDINSNRKVIDPNADGVNPFFNTNYVGNRFKHTRSRDVQDMDGNSDILFEAAVPYKAHIVVFEDGIKLRNGVVTQAANKARVSLPDTGLGELTTEAYDATPYKDQRLHANLGDIISRNSNTEFEIYRIVTIPKTTEPSFCKDIPYFEKFILEDIEDVVFFDESSFRFKTAGDFYIKYTDVGFDMDVHSVDSLLAGNMPIYFTSTGLDIPRFDSSTVVYFNGHELVEGVEYIQHLSRDVEGAVYGIELYITGMSHVKIFDNVIEIIYQRNMSMKKLHCINIPEERNFAEECPLRYSQLTVGGVSRREYFTQDGSNISTDWGRLTQVRYMVSKDEQPLVEDLTEYISTRKLINLNVTSPIQLNVIPIDAHPIVVDYFKQRIVADANLYLNSYTLDKIDTELEVSNWYNSRVAYRKINTMMRLSKTYDYLNVVPGCVNPERLHPKIHDVVNWLAEQD